MIELLEVEFPPLVNRDKQYHPYFDYQIINSPNKKSASNIIEMKHLHRLWYVKNREKISFALS